MKIYILPIDKRFQPQKSKVTYPNHNDDYGVEQDFYKFMQNNQHLIVNDPNESDFHYLPIYWTNWHIIHEYAKTGLEELRTEISRVMIDSSKTFTICQYDDGPSIDLGQTIQFLASRKNEQGIDIPLLCKPHTTLFFNLFSKPKKKYLASFIGRLKTFSLRKEMADVLKNDQKYFIYDGNNGTRFFVRKILESYVVLAPRGYGGSSFRLFEAMQLGVVPFLVGDIDTRPFKNHIDWKSCSLYANDPKQIPILLAQKSTEELLVMGNTAKEIYDEYLSYQKWCIYVIKELENYGNNI